MKRLGVLLAVAAVMAAGCTSAEEREAEERAEQAELERIREALDSLGYDSAPSEDQASVIDQVEAGFRDSYGWPNEAAWSNIEAFTDDNGDSKVTVVTSLASKAENESVAEGICNAVASVGRTVEGWRGNYVTAGHRGPFLAEC